MSAFLASINETLGQSAAFQWLGVAPVWHLCLYLVVLLCLVLLVVFFCVKRRRRQVTPGLLKRWQKQQPAAAEFLQRWQQMTTEQQQAVGELSQAQDWCLAYLLQCSKMPEAADAILTLWPYQGAGQEALLKTILKELGSPDPAQSMAAAGILKELRDDRTLPLLLVALLQPQQFLPARVCDVLMIFGTAAGRALSALYYKVEPDDATKKGLILSALGQLPEFFPAQVLQLAMQDTQPEIRQKAAEIVSLTRPDDAVAFLQPLLQDPVGKVRAAAAATLSAIGGEAVVATLRTMAAEDQDWQVKMTCQAFLTRWEERIQENLAKDEAPLWLKDTASAKEADDHAGL